MTRKNIAVIDILSSCAVHRFGNALSVSVIGVRDFLFSVRDLRYTAVVPVRIGYPQTVIPIVPCLGLPVKIIIRKFNKISVSVSLLGHKPRFIIFYFGKGSPIRAVAHEVFGRSAESVIGKFILQMIVDVYALQQVIGIRIAVRYAAR